MSRPNAPRPNAPRPNAPRTVGEAVERLTHALAGVGVETPRLDARLLVAHAIGVPPQDVLLRPERPLEAAEAAAVAMLGRRRAGGEPVSRILGTRGFWTLDLEVSADTLDPRPDTETLIEAVLDAEPDRAKPLRILDLGTGTGAILLALLSEYPKATGLGTDIAAGAVETARLNARRNGLQDRAAFRTADWGEGIDETFDVVVSNPPYIPNGDIAGLAPEVRDFDPHRALAGGPDGLDVYRLLAPQLPRLTRPGGLVALEVGVDQAADVAAILNAAGISTTWNRADLAGVSRCVCGRIERREK